MHTPTLTANHSRKKGFTLIELIVVIAIIATLLSVGIGTLKNLASSRGVSTGVSIAQGVFENARNQAKNRGVARVVIYSHRGTGNKDLRERYLKYMAVAVPDLKDEELYDQNKEYKWRLVSSGSTLPKDTFFNINLCPNVKEGKAIFTGSNDPKNCYYYEFNSEGALISPNLAAPDDAISFVIQLGTIRPNDTIPKSFPTRKKDAGGFAIWRNGKTTIYRNTKQIEKVASKAIGF